MKVVLFCGGRGIRLREFSEAIPKPMVTIGYRPILWHVMRYYAHFGHREFILCLGYRADAIKDYFLHYDEAVSNDFVLSDGGRRVELLGSDIADWRITFADTGLDTTIGERLRRVRHLLEGEEVFLANYGDTLTDAPLDSLVEAFQADTATAASFLAVRPSVYPIRIVDADDTGRVRGLVRPADAGIRINGGYFMFRDEVFDVIEPGDELVERPFARLIAEGRLRAVAYDGYWGPLDTLTDLAHLQEHVASGRAPWAPWQGDDSTMKQPPVDAALRVAEPSGSP